MKKHIVVGILIVLGLAFLSVPCFYYFFGSHKSEQLVQKVEVMIVQGREDEEKEEKEQKDAETAIDKENAATLEGEGVIGLIEIEALSLKYAILEGAESSQLAYGIGHIPDTAGIGETGNCVLAGHRGSRYGMYFKYLNQLKRGDLVRVTDKRGDVFIYEVQSSEVVDPYDNFVKAQGEKKELSLLTCDKNGTMRLIVRCSLKEVMRI